MEEVPDVGADPAEFFVFPEKELEKRQGGRRKQVCVIGAGIAGLVAAYELAGAGCSVVLVEADRRVGGRIRTWHVGGVSAELGPMRVPRKHAGTMHYIEKVLKLDCDPFYQRNEAGWLLLRNQKERIANWTRLFAAYGDTTRPRLLFPGLHLEQADDEPMGIFDRALAGPKLKLTTEELWSVMNGTPGPTARALGSMTLWQAAQGMPEDPLGWAGPLGPGMRLSEMELPWHAFSDAGWEFIGRATGMLWEERISALEVCIETPWVSGSDRVRPKEGMEALPKGLEAELLAKHVGVKLGVAVTRVRCERDPDRVRVYSAAGEIEPEDGDGFDYVVCAVPAAATARIAFEPELSAKKFEALSGLTYMSAAKTLVLVQKRRWEMGKEQIFCGASYTDLPIQQCWYPADNAEPVDGGGDEDDSAFATTQRGLAGPQGDEQAPNKFVAKSKDRSREPAILTAAYMTGVNAERFVSQTEEQRTEEVLHHLEALHAGIRKDILDVKHDVEHCSWIEGSTPSGGAWTYHGAGSHERYQDALCEAHPAGREPQVFFAGEHLCVLHGWMQSAIQSSLEAVVATLDAR